MVEMREARRSEARMRLLTSSAEIFYREGIHAVGVDRLVSEAGVTRATFYRHFPSKDDLVLAYIEREDQALRELFSAGAAGAAGAEEAVEIILEGIALDVEHHHTRGCPFINAAAEFPDPAHRVRKAVRAHRDWFSSALAEVLIATGRPDADEAAQSLVLLRDAALVGAYIDGSTNVVPAFLRTARRILDSQPTQPA